MTSATAPAASAAPVVQLGDPAPRPWRRYFARMLDTLLGQLVGGLMIGIAMPGVTAALTAEGNDYFWYLAACCIALPLEAFALSVFATTPGKALLGLQVRTDDGRHLGFGPALARTGQMWVTGLGIGFPLACLFTMARAKANLEREQTTGWDRAVGTSVRYTRSRSAA